MRDRLPDAAVNRKKHGFAVPMSQWLRGPLAPLLREMLHPDRLTRLGLFDAKVVTKLVSEHTGGRRDRGRELWPLLLFELWRVRWLPAQ
jgi:asparagine synthase (glutamine-hydrolysing)